MLRATRAHSWLATSSSCVSSPVSLSNDDGNGNENVTSKQIPVIAISSRLFCKNIFDFITGVLFKLCLRNLHLSLQFFFSLHFEFSSWLKCSTPDRVVRIRVLAGDIVLCSWARHLTFTVPLSTQVYKWVPANLMLGITLRWTSIPSRGE